MVGKDSQRGAVVRVAAQVETPVQERRRVSAGAILSLIALAVLLIFIFQNTSHIRVHFLWLYFSWALWLYTIVMAVVGAAVWFGLGVMRRHRRRVERRAERRLD
jgi:uncharacterized integral membrane protein